jgi:methyltransferase (TIGR00027 family)
MTALGASLMRAFHTRLDRPPLIDDSWGDRLVSDAERDAMLRLGLGLLEPATRERIQGLGSRDEMLAVLMRGHPNYGTIVIRSRHAEDALAAAVARGMRQYVIVGAGMDSFGLRRPAFAREVEVFEVDHPATQKLKLERLGECGVSPPTGVHFVAADLSQEGLDAALTQSSFDSLRPAFFSWLGVTQYLTREANLQTFRAIASCAAEGSEVVFTYADQRDLDGSGTSDVARFKTTGAAVGEPWVSGFLPAELGDQLAAAGLRLVEDLGPEDLRERYCAGRADALAPSAAMHIARAHAAV